MTKKNDDGKNALALVRPVEDLILILRDQRVMLDSDLAKLYGVSTKRLNEQVKRNRERFPEDFMFQLSREEKAEVVANCDHLRHLKFSPSLPNAFTEHGAIMAASVLNSPRAIEVSVFVVRAFIKLRQTLAAHREMSKKLAQLEDRLDTHDQAIHSIITAFNNSWLRAPKPISKSVSKPKRRSEP